MRLKLDDPNDFTIERFAQMIAEKSPDEHHQIRIYDDGYVELSDDFGNLNLEGVTCRFETWSAGTDYCGPDAAADRKWVERHYNDVLAAYKKKLKGYIDLDPQIDY